ncbi:MAG: methyltransferase domain-containing protein, partial [Proteobacteria bacterium]|nr:methyltransferase domain-containing protein [Pseudomonadota bacterium]
MDWDPERYEQWFDTAEGRFALDCETRLLQSVLAGWPRRGHKLLELGCGTGLILEMLYQMGFDVTGLDNSPEMIMAARRRLGNRAELHLGNGELTPYADNEFDYALIWATLEFSDDPAAMLTEAARVAEKGVLVGFLNKHSLYYAMNVRNTGSTLDAGTWHTWCEIQDMIKRATGFRPTTAQSVLPGPLQTWKAGRLAQCVNCGLYPPFVGAFGPARV